MLASTVTVTVTVTVTAHGTRCHKRGTEGRQVWRDEAVMSDTSSTSTDVLWSCDLRIGRMVAEFPRGEADLRSQMRRASRSVPFNIGEGVGKRGKARAAAYEIALGEAKELIVALDCVEIDELAAVEDVIAAQDLVDRICAMLTKLIRSAQAQVTPP